MGREKRLARDAGEVDPLDLDGPLYRTRSRASSRRAPASVHHEVAEPVYVRPGRWMVRCTCGWEGRGKRSRVDALGSDHLGTFQPSPSVSSAKTGNSKSDGQRHEGRFSQREGRAHLVTCSCGARFVDSKRSRAKEAWFSHRRAADAGHLD